MANDMAVAELIQTCLDHGKNFYPLSRATKESLTSVLEIMGENRYQVIVTDLGEKAFPRYFGKFSIKKETFEDA